MDINFSITEFSLCTERGEHCILNSVLFYYAIWYLCQFLAEDPYFLKRVSRLQYFRSHNFRFSIMAIP